LTNPHFIVVLNKFFKKDAIKQHLEIISKGQQKEQRKKMKADQIPYMVVKEAVAHFLDSLGEDAVSVIVEINTNPYFRRRLGEIAISEACKIPPTNPAEAREIMGKNFFGIEETIKHFGVKPTEEQIKVFNEVPWSKKMLESCKDTHILAFVLSLSIIDINNITKKLTNRSLFYPLEWNTFQTLAKRKGKVGWQLVRKKPLSKSTSKTLKQQRVLLKKDEGVPDARIMVYVTLGHFLATGERLFEQKDVRCADHVIVGLNINGIYLEKLPDHISSHLVGLASAKKPN